MLLRPVQTNTYGVWRSAHDDGNILDGKTVNNHQCQEFLLRTAEPFPGVS
jgi:hypothetical protein